MNEFLQIILLVIPLIAGGVAIFLTYQLMKKHSLPFVSSYFYYIIFLFIFGGYSLIGSGILEQIFIRMEADPKIIQSGRFFNILLGIPLLVLANFMLLRTITDFFGRKIHLAMTFTYFLLSLTVFAIYGFFVVRLTRFDLGEYKLLVSVQRWVFIGFTEIMYMLVFFTALFLSEKTKEYKQRFIRVFGSWYLLYMILSCVSFFLIPKHDVVAFIFIFIFLSWHLIPILFLNLYLEKYHGKTTIQELDFESKLNLLVEEFEISKREREVIQLICKGLSNQEISDALFISLQTVKDHIHHIFVKTGVKNRIQLNNLIGSRQS